MTLEEFVKAQGRMCASRNCFKCPMFYTNNGLGAGCRTYAAAFPAAVIAIVEKWAAEHPEPHKKTYAEDYFEKFPNAQRDEDGTPKSCRRYAYNNNECFMNCKACWDEPMPEENT